MKATFIIDPALVPRVASAMARTRMHADELAAAGLVHVLADIEARPDHMIPRSDIMDRQRREPPEATH